MQPLISVVLPVHNTEKYLPESLASIFAQTYKTIEIICIDDGSTDNTPEILKSYGDKIKIITNNQQSGIAYSRNRGIEIAQGEFVAFMDADDIAKPERFEKQIELLLKKPNLDICFTMLECFVSPELPDEIKSLRQCPRGPQPGIVSPTALIRSSVFAKVGLLDEKLRVGEFVDWMARATNLGLHHESVPDTLLLRRIHDTNVGVTQRDSRGDYLKVVKAALARKRAQ